MSLDNANTAPIPEPSYEKGNDALSRQSQALLMKRHQHEESKVVEKGDTLGKLAQVHLGKGANAHQIYNYVNKIGKENDIKNVNHIEPGQTIYFPPLHHHKKDGHDDRVKKEPKPSEAPVAAKVTDPAAKAVDDKTGVVKAGDPAAKPATGDKPAVVKAGDPAAKPATGDKTTTVTPGDPVPKIGADGKPVIGPDGTPVLEQPAGDARKTDTDGKTDLPKDTSAATDPKNVLPADQRESALAAIGHGMGEELRDNTLGVIGSAGLGAAAVAASKFLPGYAKWAVAGIGAVAATYEAYEHGGALVKSAQVESNPDKFTAAEQKASNDTLHGLGRGITDFTAGAIGGGIAGLASSAIRYGGLSSVGSTISKIGMGGGPLYEKAALPPLNRLGLPAPDGQIALPGPSKQLLLSGPDKAIPAAAPDKVIALSGPDKLASGGALTPEKPLLLTGPDKITPVVEPTPEKVIALYGPDKLSPPVTAATPEKVVALTGTEHVAPAATATPEKPLLLTGPEQAAEPTEAEKKQAWSIISEKMNGPKFAIPGELPEVPAAKAAADPAAEAQKALTAPKPEGEGSSLEGHSAPIKGIEEAAPVEHADAAPVERAELAPAEQAEAAPVEQGDEAAPAEQGDEPASKGKPAKRQRKRDVQSKNMKSQRGKNVSE